LKSRPKNTHEFANRYSITVTLVRPGARRSPGRARFTMSQSQPQRSYPQGPRSCSDSYVGPNGMKQAGGPCGEQKQRHAPSWSQAASPPSFPTARIDLWKVSLDEPSKSNMEEGSQALLSPDEIARALRFHFEKGPPSLYRLSLRASRPACEVLAIPAAEIRLVHNLRQASPRSRAESSAFSSTYPTQQVWR